MFARAAVRIMLGPSSCMCISDSSAGVLVTQGISSGREHNRHQSVYGALLGAGNLVKEIPQAHPSLSIAASRPYINLFTMQQLLLFQTLGLGRHMMNLALPCIQQGPCALANSSLPASLTVEETNDGTTLEDYSQHFTCLSVITHALQLFAQLAGMP